MEILRKNVSVGDLVAFSYNNERAVTKIESINENRNLVTLEGWLGSFQAPDIIVVKNLTKSLWLRPVGNTLLANYGFDLYINKDASYTLRPVKLGNDLPANKFVKFNTYEDFLNVCEDKQGVDLVQLLKEKYL